jgi:hypothetical protein
LYSEKFDVSSGQFKGYSYWGMHIPGDPQGFQPHGYGILINSKLKIFQVGTFKLGQEHGQ